MRYYGPNKIKQTARIDRFKFIPETFEQLKELVAPVEKLFDSGYEDNDGAFMIFYVNCYREFFHTRYHKLFVNTDGFRKKCSKDEKQELEKYITELQRVIGACAASYNKLENEKDKPYIRSDKSEISYLQKQQSSLVTEQVLCDKTLKEIQCLYRIVCKKYGCRESTEYTRRITTMNFNKIYELMTRIIIQDPENDHYYNALMQAFMTYKDVEEQAGRKIDVGHIVNIQIIIEEGKQNIPQEKQAGEFLNHVMRFNEIEHPQLTIESINKNELGEYADYFNNPNTKADVILFVCQNELKTTESDRARAVRDVYEFLSKKEFSDYIKNKPLVIEYRLKITWEMFTGRQLLMRSECQCIGLKQEQWEELFNISGQYLEATKNTDIVRKPALLLVHALSLLHTEKENSYLKAQNFIQKNITDSIFFGGNIRMMTPFMVCDEKGEPYKYSGKQSEYDVSNRNTFWIKIDGIGLKCRCRSRNIGRRELPRPSEQLQLLEIGMGYTGFSVYVESERKKAGERRS